MDWEQCGEVKLILDKMNKIQFKRKTTSPMHDLLVTDHQDTLVKRSFIANISSE